MARFERIISIVGGAIVISALGGLYTTLGTGQAVLVLAASGSSIEALIEFLLIGVPGLGLLYGGYWLRRSDLRPDVHPRVAVWCLSGAGVMAAIVALLVFNPGGSVSRPFRAAAIATALGGLGGLGIGVNEGWALSRAREAEHHRDDLREERDLRERILETSPVGIGVVDIDGSIRIINEHAADIVGIPRDELTDLRYDDPLFTETGTDGDPETERLFERIRETGEPVYDREARVTRADGERIWLSVNGAPLYDSTGEFTAIIFAFKDVTERKQLEADLKQTVDRLEQSNERLRQFAYAASHDLQEPLRMVSSYLQLLEDRYKSELDSEAGEFIEFAVDGADRMREMVDDLLAYTRIKQREEQEFEPVDCNAVIERVLSDLQVQIEETDADIVTGPLPTVEAVENQLEQLFQNLISNALKYNDGEPRVEITAEQRNERWHFTVTDNGIGIDPDMTGRIFNVFQRLHNEDEYPGTGVGLSLCQEIITNHRGEIWADSEPGEGSTFHFTFPNQDTARGQERAQ